MNEKKVIRENILALRKSITNRKEKSQLIVDKIKENRYFQKSQVICLYKPLPYEIDINDLIYYALLCGKKVLLPRVVDNDLIFLQINKDTTYEKSNFHVLEPQYSQELVNYDYIDLIIVPGLAFSFQNDRLGYGKGFYDRFLKKEKGYKIGVCFQEQYLEYLPVNKDDIPMDLVIYA